MITLQEVTCESYQYCLLRFCGKTPFSRLCWCSLRLASPSSFLPVWLNSQVIVSSPPITCAKGTVAFCLKFVLSLLPPACVFFSNHEWLGRPAHKGVCILLWFGLPTIQYFMRLIVPKFATFRGDSLDSVPAHRIALHCVRRGSGSTSSAPARL